MSNKRTVHAAAVAATLGALGRARAIRDDIEQRDRAHRAAPSNSPGDVLTRLRANEELRAAMRGEK